MNSAGFLFLAEVFITFNLFVSSVKRSSQRITLKINVTLTISMKTGRQSGFVNMHMCIKIGSFGSNCLFPDTFRDVCIRTNKHKDTHCIIGKHLSTRREVKMC